MFVHHVLIFLFTSILKILLVTSLPQDNGDASLSQDESDFSDSELLGFGCGNSKTRLIKERAIIGSPDGSANQDWTEFQDDPMSQDSTVISDGPMDQDFFLGFETTPYFASVSLTSNAGKVSSDDSTSTPVNEIAPSPGTDDFTPGDKTLLADAVIDARPAGWCLYGTKLACCFYYIITVTRRPVQKKTCGFSRGEELCDYGPSDEVGWMCCKEAQGEPDPATCKKGGTRPQIPHKIPPKPHDIPESPPQRSSAYEHVDPKPMCLPRASPPGI